jgi:hypothetical protein
MALDSRDATILQGILEREGASLMQYARESYPWTTPEKHRLLARLNELIEEEQKSAAAVARLLAANHVPLPAFGAYPSDFTTVNFISLGYLLPELVESQRRAVGRIEFELLQISDPLARATVQGLLDTKRQHLPALEELTSTNPRLAKV